MRAARVMIAATVLAVVLTGCSSMNQEWHHDCVVNSKERLIADGSSAEKRVYTSCGSFTVNDSMSGGFSSQDSFNKLVEGRTFDIQTAGYRIGLLSRFPNVIDVKPK